MANNKDKKFFGKMLNFIGLEESTEEEQDYRYEDGGDYDEFDDSYYSASEMDDEDDADSASFMRGKKRGGRETPKPVGREPQKPNRDFKRTREAVQEVPSDNRGNVVGFSSGGSVGSSTGSSKMKMIVYQPMTYDDTQNIIDNLKNRKPIIVNLESLETDIAQRILDFMSGAVYSLDGNIHKISKGIFILAPANVDISGNIPEELQGKSFYTLGNKPRREY